MGQVLDEEELGSLLHLSCVVSESLRFEPAVSTSVTAYMTKDVKLKNLWLRKDDKFIIQIRHLHMNPDEWIEPHRYIPERFDQNSPYYLTPKGEKRNPFSFIPFIGGKRVCLGKTFADLTMKNTISGLVNSFNFEFSDEKYKTEWPINNIQVNFQVPMPV